VVDAAAAPATSGSATFEQYIDHSNPSLGTFSQSYSWSSQYCTKAGCPVVLFTPGEVNASGYGGYLTNATLTGQFAKAIGGAVILIEHRYWGESSPYADLSTKNMQYLTLNNSIHDLTHFARTVKLPFDKNGSSNADKAPWVLAGGSYSGALSAWTESVAPGTFWAYHASSAPVEAIYDYWQYFQPVNDGMPKNCSKDLGRVIDHIDHVLASGSEKEKHDLKDMFGLADVTANDDFGAALENGPWLWQSNRFYANGGFFEMCDAVENAGLYSNTTKTFMPGADGVGLAKALPGYANWFKKTFLPGWCEAYGYADWQGEMNVQCFNTHNASSPMYTDHTLSNGFDRQWQWFLCNEPFGYWQDGAPKNTNSLVSRFVTGDYWENQCQLFFPEQDGYTFGYAKGKREADVNAFTKGWSNTNTTRLLWVNGEFDPWRSSGVSSIFRPGGPLQSTEQAPVDIVPGGYHCSDLLMKNGQVNAGVAAVQQKEIDQIVAWVNEWPGKAPSYVKRTFEA